jgi:exo-beta-1,3-glucanase (GH17 family)
VPSRVNEAKFMRGFVAMAEANGWHYNLIEAFDQPWKRASEGAVGGYWACSMPIARTRASSPDR